MGRVIQTLPEREPVWAVTSLDDRLYVLRGNKTDEQIEVYDIDSCRFLQFLTVHGLGDTYAYDIVVCGHNRCAYICDFIYDNIFKVALPDRAEAVTRWPVYDKPAHLSHTHTRFAGVIL